MPLDPSIILSGQPLNLLGAIQSGNQLAAQANEIRRGNALADLYRTQGQGLMSGDPAALNALAAYDPQAAMQIKASQQDMANNAETMQMRRDAAKREAETYAAGLADAERKAQADKIEQGVAAGLAAKSPEEWDALVTQFGAPDLKGQFGNRMAIAHSYLGIADALKGMQPGDPQSPIGKLQADFNAGLIPKSAYDAAIARAGSDGVTVNLGGGSDKQIFDAMATSADSANAAMTGLNALREAKSAVDQGIISGSFADQQLALQKIGAALGVTDPAKIVNTETFRSAIAPQVAATMKATVGSTQISNADREFAEKAAAGSITLDEASIKRLLDIMERSGTAIIQRHMDKLNKVYPEGKGFDRERALFGVTAPQNAPPATAGGGAPAGFEDIWNKY